MSHPAWVCGLKHYQDKHIALLIVTPCVGVWIETEKGSLYHDAMESHTLRGCVD